MNSFPGARPKRIAIDFHDPTPGDGVNEAVQSTTNQDAGQTANHPLQVANPSPGATPAPLDQYANLAQGLLGGQQGGGGVNFGFNPATALSGGARGGPMNMSDLVRFSATPQGRAAIQGAIDQVISQRKAGQTNPNVNPYQSILASLRSAMGYPVTA